MVGCSKKQLNTIARGALLHDMGKIGDPGFHPDEARAHLRMRSAR